MRPSKQEPALFGERAFCRGKTDFGALDKVRLIGAAAWVTKCQDNAVLGSKKIVVLFHGQPRLSDDAAKLSWFDVARRVPGDGYRCQRSEQAQIPPSAFATAIALTTANHAKMAIADYIGYATVSH
jgi:hypothetical protein